MANIKPILRIFDKHKALEFYIDWLGFTLDWVHDTNENVPVYMQVSKDDIAFHLSEHHGDGTPGTRVLIENFDGVQVYQKQLINKKHKYNSPGIEHPFYDETLWELTVTDPFNNQITFTGKS